MIKMTLKQLIKLEDKAKNVWVISPSLHYDIDVKDFGELVSVNLGQKTKYRYIVPATAEITKNIAKYQKKYKLTDAEIDCNFCIIGASDFMPFVTETAIYNAKSDCVACCAPAMENSQDVIKYNAKTSKAMAKAFKATWKKYKRCNP